MNDDLNSLVGHNGPPPEGGPEFSADALRSLVERIEAANVEVKTTQEFRKDIYSEAKSRGFNVKVLRRIIAIRARDPDDVAEEDAETETYLSVLT